MAADFSSPSMMLRCARAIGSLKPSAISDVSSGASSCSSARASAWRLARWMLRESTSGTLITTSDTRMALRSTAGSSTSRASAVQRLESSRRASARRWASGIASGLEQHRSGHQRAGERAPPRLVGTGHEPRTELAVVPQQLAQRRCGRAAAGGDGHHREPTGAVGGASRADRAVIAPRCGRAATRSR